MSDDRSRWVYRHGTAASSFIGLLGLALFLLGCHSGGSSGSISPPSSASPQLEQEAAQQLLRAYQTALLQEDIDQLQTLLHDDGGNSDGQAFREIIAETFRRFSVTNVEINEVSIQSAAEPFTVSFRETLSIEDPIARIQGTRSVRTTWRLVRQGSASGTLTILIAAVTRVAPHIEVVTRGLPHAGRLTRVEVTETSRSFAPTGVEVEVPETGGRTPLAPDGGRFLGSFIAPALAHPQALRVRLRSSTGDEVLVSHHYRVRQVGEGAVERIADTGTRRFFAVSTGRDGTAWFGGEADRSRVAGILVQVSSDGQLILRQEQPFLSQLPAEAVSRVEDLAIDDFGRVHALFVAHVGAQGTVVDPGVVANGVVVQDLQHPDQLCQTMNVFARDPQTGESRVDQDYPFLVNGQPSPSTRVFPAGGREVWLFGSDGGVARVVDDYREGECLQDRVEVRYDPIFRRDESGLLSNTVPALATGADSALWFGTAFGLARFADGQFTPVPFDPNLSLRGNASTLEAFYREVARAIFETRPVSAVQIGGVSFLDAFGVPLLKENLIFSLTQDPLGGLWVGTLGGGIRRIEVRAGALLQTLHLTRQQGLASNIIFALAAGPDGAIWAATEEGVSRVQDVGGEPVITNYTTLDGLAVPVRDVAVGGNGAVWFATDGGMFQMRTATGVLRGVVRDTAGRPVAGADVRIPGTGFWTVTDAEGRFVLVNLPPGAEQLLVDGSAALGGPFTAEVVDVTIATEERELQAPVSVAPRPTVARLQAVSGDGQRGDVGIPLPSPLVVAVQDGAGRGIAGAPVAFMVTAGSGVLESEVVITDAGGRAANSLIPTAEGPIQVTASVDGLERVFVANAVEIGTRCSGGGIKPRLIKISGNNQSGRPGQELPDPLVVRLEDQFGEPIVGGAVSAEIVRGDGDLTQVSCQNGITPPGSATTDQFGEACFRLRLGATSEEDVIVRVSALDLTVQFLAIVGTVDTPDTPLDLAVVGDVVYVADRFGDLQIIDVGDPSHPTKLTPVTIEGESAHRLAISGHRLYVITFPLKLRVFDITDPRTPMMLGARDFPSEVQQANHRARGLVIKGDLAFVVTDDPLVELGSLQVFDVSNPVNVRHIGRLSLDSQASHLAVLEDLAYVPAGKSGLLVLNISDPTRPALVGSLGDPNPVDTAGTLFLSAIALRGNFAYLVETRLDRLADRREDRFTVLDLSTPTVPRRRGSVQTRIVRAVENAPAIALSGEFAYLVQFAFGVQGVDISDPDVPTLVGSIDTPSQALNITAAGTFIYVADQIFGLQVIRGPSPDAADSDCDGVIDFFDAFPDDALEMQDTDGDGIGDNADLDDDNDGFSDEEERRASPPTDPLNSQSFPITPPPPGTTSIVVDATAPFGGNGTPAAPYRSITTGIRALVEGKAPQTSTLLVRAGVYAPSTTQEVLPLDLTGLAHLTLQGAGSDVTVIDAEFAGDIFSLTFNRQLMIDGFRLTHGATAIRGQGVTTAIIRRNRIEENIQDGITLGLNFNFGNTIVENLIARNGLQGIVLFENGSATVAGNTITENFGIGIGLQLGSSANITNNKIVQNKLNGITIQGKSTATITANHITENKINGIFIRDVSEATASTNVISNNGCDGIHTDNSVVIINENEVVQNGCGGIFLDDTSFARIYANSIQGNNLEGIRVEYFSSANIMSNIIKTNKIFGVFATSNSTVGLDSNQIVGNESVGTLINSRSEGYIRGNTISETEGDGIGQGSGIIVDDHSTSEITGNMISKNKAFGIVVRGSSRASIMDNGVGENGNDGILLIKTSTAEMTANIITENHADGIRLLDKSTTTLINNTVRHNSDDGIQIGNDVEPNLKDGSFAAIRGSTISDNGGNGVFIVGASSAAIGLEGEAVTVADNGSTGILISADGSSAEINSARIIFANNGLGDIIGSFGDFPDADLDGLSDGEEAERGTDPNNPDTDGDTFSDGVEVASGSDPLISGHVPTMILMGPPPWCGGSQHSLCY